jgi:hypothetical protein
MHDETILAARLVRWTGRALVIGLVWLASACGDGNGDEPLVLKGTIGAGGGELTGAAGGPFSGVRVVVPAGALTKEVELWVEGVIDPTPLAATAERVGPQFALRPEGIEFAKPVEVTVPFDPKLRAPWDVPDDDCRVWYRNGAGWARAEQTASDADGVTVELSRATTFAAGVLKTSRDFDCTLFNNCTTATVTPSDNCRDGDRFCIARVDVEHAPSYMNYYTLAGPRLYWVTSPAPDTLQLASMNVNTGETALSGTLVASTSGGLRVAGDVAVDTDDSVWLALPGVGNVRFSGTRAATRYDTRSDETPAGMAFDPNEGRVSRITERVDPDPRKATVLLTRTQGSKTRYVLAGYSSSVRVPEVRQLGRATGPTAQRSLLAFVPGNGVYRMSFDTSGYTRYTRCGSGDLLSGQLHEIAVSEDDLGFALLCSDEGNAQWIDGGDTHLASTQLSDQAGKFGRMAIDRAGTVWLAPLDRAVVIRIDRLGGMTTIPLSDDKPGTASYNGMIPRSIHYAYNEDALVIVTRGSRSIPEIWRADRLR